MKKLRKCADRKKRLAESISQSCMSPVEGFLAFNRTGIAVEVNIFSVMLSLHMIHKLPH